MQPEILVTAIGMEVAYSQSIDLEWLTTCIILFSTSGLCCTLCWSATKSQIKHKEDCFFHLLPIKSAPLMMCYLFKCRGILMNPTVFL